MPAAAEYDDALMDQRLDIDAPAVKIDAGRAVAPDLRQNGRGQCGGVRVEAALRRGGVGNVHKPDPEGGPAAALRRLAEGRKLFGREPLHDHIGIRREPGHVEMHQAGGSRFTDRETCRQHVGFDLPAADGSKHGQIPRDQHLRPRVARGGTGTLNDRGEG